MKEEFKETVVEFTAKRIAELREKRGWTTNRLANNSGLSQSFIRDVENGDKSITITSLSYICDALDISLESFFSAYNLSNDYEKMMTVIKSLTEDQLKKLSDFISSIKG